MASEAARDQLSDGAFRLYVEAALWLYQMEDHTLRIPRHMLARISAADDPAAAAAELVKRKWLREAGEDLVLARHGNTIRSSLIVQQEKREQGRVRQARYRNKRRPGEESVTQDVTRNQASKQASEQASTDEGTQPRRLCKVGGCGMPARRSCRTCADHMALEDQ